MGSDVLCYVHNAKVYYTGIVHGEMLCVVPKRLSQEVNPRIFRL